METSDLVLGLNPDAVLALGDTQYERGAYADFLASWAASWGRLGDKVYPVVGNHEYLTPGAAGYFDLSLLPRLAELDACAGTLGIGIAARGVRAAIGRQAPSRVRVVHAHSTQLTFKVATELLSWLVSWRRCTAASAEAAVLREVSTEMPLRVPIIVARSAA